MQHSDDEDDFLSADEEAYDEDHEGCERATTQSKPSEKTPRKAESVSSNDRAVEEEQKEGREEEETTDKKSTSDEQRSDTPANKDAFLDKQDDAGREIVTQHAATQDNKEQANSGSSSQEQPCENAKNLDEEEEDDEEALVERIRERNLKIARKFSAEIAKNLKVSAPIPVETTSSHSNRDTDYPSGLGTPSGRSAFLPPAPPPTPALSSSFSNLNDQPTHQTSTVAPTLSSQYSWRVPSTKQQIGSGSSSPSSKAKSEDQARQALDRLAEKLSHTDKNLFERVTEDIKKVSIKDEEASSSSATLSNVTSQLPLSSISDLGSALGGWGWSGATKLLSSASHVTSHVGSVLDSVLQPDEQRVDQARPAASAERINCEAGALAGREDESESRAAMVQPRPEGNSGMPGDPLVDFTLNAMESLGKRAFGVMTTRDESGSLQIKGLGRPWEHLLSTKTTNDRSSTPPPQPPGVEKPSECDPIETSEPLIEREAEIDRPHLPSTLKNRKKRYDD